MFKPKHHPEPRPVPQPPSDAPHETLLWATLFAFAVFLVLFLHPLYAPAATPTTSSLDTRVTGRFNMGRTYRFEMGVQPGAKKLAARIKSPKGKVVAVCKNLEANPSRLKFDSTMDLNFECTGSELQTMGVHMAVFWKDNQPRIQFGTWLQGYEGATLTLDRAEWESIRAALSPVRSVALAGHATH